MELTSNGKTGKAKRE